MFYLVLKLDTYNAFPTSSTRCVFSVISSKSTRRVCDSYCPIRNKHEQSESSRARLTSRYTSCYPATTLDHRVSEISSRFVLLRESVRCPLQLSILSFVVVVCHPQALGLQDSDDEAEAEEKAVEEVSDKLLYFHFLKFSPRINVLF